jgi:CDGSH-type Zn-finger protein
MDDASKAVVKATHGIGQDSQNTADPQASEASGTFVAYMDDSGQSKLDSQRENLTTSAKALDRWFAGRKTSQGAPRLLEIPNEALITSAGPINLTGNITLVNEDGSITYANHLSLCRCGGSKSKPTCDDRHLDIEFLHSGRISEASEARHSERPTKITVSCVKDGPIKFRGRLRIRNNLSQECVKLRGALCRCGQSASKPFCDGSHEKVGFRSGR